MKFIKLNRMKNYKISFLLIVICLFTACDDYLEVTPKGEVIPETVEDFELLLNGGRMHSLADNIIQYMSDDVYITQGIESESVPLVNAYYWKRDMDFDITQTPSVWQNMYGTIYYANSIINNLEKATGASQQKKDEVLGEALAVRVLAEFYLLTVFSNAYNPEVNPQDLGIPPMTSTSVTEAIPPRATLKESFDRIIADLTKAIQILPEVQSVRYRATKFAAQGLLARVYLYIGDFEKANTYATAALLSPQTDKVLDYNTFTGTTSFPSEEQNNEKIWLDTHRVSGTPSYSNALLEVYGPNDIRVPLFTKDQSNGEKTRDDNTKNAGISYPEMLMIQAEYEARMGSFTKAIEIVNDLREKRLPATASDLIVTASNKAEALVEVLKERRRELVFSQTRWMDMKRLDLLGEMPDVHRYQDNDPAKTVFETLEKGSSYYTFEIPLKVRTLNPSIQLNH